MDDTFKIYIEQLRDGHIEKIEEIFQPDFLDIEEKELSFRDDVLLKGEAYLAEDMLVLNLHANTQAVLLCSICNAPVKVNVNVQGFYYAEPLAEIKGGVFNFKEILREAILLEIPQFVECEGKCPRRSEISQYLKEPAEKAKQEEDEGYHPFADFDWDKIKKKK